MLAVAYRSYLPNIISSLRFASRAHSAVSISSWSGENAYASSFYVCSSNKVKQLVLAVVLVNYIQGALDVRDYYIPFLKNKNNI